MKAISVILQLTFFASIEVFAQESACTRVYENSVMNLTVSSKMDAERNSIFSEHCESNGSMRQSSAGIDLTIPIKKVKIGFSGSESEAKQEMQDFCKYYSSDTSKDSSKLEFTNTVVTDALKSFNDCIALEKKGILITHQLQEPSSLIVSVKFNPSDTILDVTGVTISNMSCNTTALSGRTTKLSGAIDEFRAKKPFTIQCNRNSTASRGNRNFERASFGLATSLGTYSIVLPSEGLLGYDLANQNRLRHESYDRKIYDLEQRTAMIDQKFRKITSIPHYVTQGQDATVNCPQWGGNINSYAESVCLDGKVSGLKTLRAIRGAKCGYTTYIFTCAYE